MQSSGQFQCWCPAPQQGFVQEQHPFWNRARDNSLKPDILMPLPKEALFALFSQI